MFQFTRFASIAGYTVFIGMGCPIRKSWNQRLFAPLPSLSQLITSFFASESLGIRHTLLITSFYSFFVNQFSLILSIVVNFISFSNTSKNFILIFKFNIINYES